jgi:hypothetical protein
MTNPFVALWLVVDAVAVVALLRLLRSGASARTSAIVMAALQLAALGAAVASASLDIVVNRPGFRRDSAALIHATGTAGC